MKKTVLLILLLCLIPTWMLAVRAYPRPKTIIQSDGTTLTIIGHGDEYLHYVTTTDGYTVVKGIDGIYRYAVLEDGCLKPSGIKARDADDRSALDQECLHDFESSIKPAVTATGRKLMKLMSRTDAPLFRHGARCVGKYGETGRTGQGYRGLVIMVNFIDRKFSRGDASRQLVDDMMNKPDRTSYEDQLLNARVECTGSVHDYFRDNSNGRFVPAFDVVGPIDIDASQYYINGAERTYELCRQVLEAADPEIDYSRYDSDGDGVVDMFYIMYAGYSSNYQGNDERLVWPHAGHFKDSDEEVNLDGMTFGRFACSSEIYGWHDDGDVYLDGIGVIVHEFSHVLGFQDHYDVSGYLNEDPGTWDVMASGNYNGLFNDTPCGYNSYEKYSAGFITPRTLTRTDNNERIHLQPLASSGQALRIVSTQDSTVFMLENRQKDKWDKELPGHGMLVWRVDSCDNEYWTHNALNVNGRLHFKLVRAMGATRTLFQEIEDKDYDPFPGTRNVDELTNYSLESNMLTDRRYPSPLVLRDIEEVNGIISLTVEEDVDASGQPYTFCLKDRYAASGIDADGNGCGWNVHTDVIQSGSQSRLMIYDLVPDTKNIAATDSRYSKGLGAAYSISSDRKQIFIEPYRVALLDDYGVWLVDFNDLDKGGSGCITLNMTPYGDISVSNPDSRLGYCLLPKNSAVVVPEKIVERFSIVTNVRFDSASHNSIVTLFGHEMKENARIFNLTGIPVSNPQKGEIYIVNGRKVRY